MVSVSVEKKKFKYYVNPVRNLRVVKIVVTGPQKFWSRGLEFLNGVNFFLLFALVLPFFISISQAQASDQPKYPPLKYVAQLKDLGEYYLYANGGFHADWYIGHNNCWIVKLPPMKKDGFVKAFIGAKIGRAKTASFPTAYDTAPVLGKVYMAVASEPQFTSDSAYFLASTDEIPREALPSDSIAGVDSAKWFWASVPLSRISSEKPNYLAIWAQGNEFVSSSSSPIIAAGYGEYEEEEVSVWLNHSIKGNPPSGENVLETPIAGVRPALAVKLVPPNEFKVVVKNFNAELEGDSILANFSVIGVDIERAWLEMSYDKFEWQKITPFLYSSPYFATLNRDELSSDMFYLRVAAQDSYENTGYSQSLTIPRKTGSSPK